MKAFVHYNNKKVYVKTGTRTMIQESGVWVPAVQYTTLENPQLTFVRSEAEFNEKFMEIELPDVSRPRSFDPSNL